MIALSKLFPLFEDSLGKGRASIRDEYVMVHLLVGSQFPPQVVLNKNVDHLSSDVVVVNEI